VKVFIHGTTVSIHPSLDVKRDFILLMHFIPYRHTQPKSASRFDLQSPWLLPYSPFNSQQTFAAVIEPLLEVLFLSDCFGLDEMRKSRCLVHKNGVA